MRRRLADADRDLAVARAMLRQREQELARLDAERTQQADQASGQSRRLELLSEQLR